MSDTEEDYQSEDEEYEYEEDGGDENVEEYEYEGDGRITIGDLCHNILQRPRDAFAEALLELVSVEEDSHIEFPEFVSLITNYLMMEKMEMYVRAAGAAAAAAPACYRHRRYSSARAVATSS